jgi:Mg2+ and Co2+ transporter CorA
MYGMNIPLPFQHEPWAFAFVFPLSLLLSWLVFVVAKKRRIF